MKQSMRAISAVLSAAVLFLILFSVIAVADPYTIIDLGILGGSQSVAYGINEFGQVVGFSTVEGDMNIHAFFFTNGQMSDLGTLGGDDSLAYAINAAGQIVGWSALASGGIGDGFLYLSGQMHSIVSPGEAFDINDSGVITGRFSAYSSSRAFSHDGYGITWLDGGNSSGNAINNLGQIAGDTQTSIFLYSDGHMTDLGAMVGEHSYATGINNFGHIVGNSYLPDLGEWRAFLYTNGTMIDIGTFGGGYTHASAINDSGQIVGSSQDSSGTDRAFLYSDGEMVALQDLIPQDSGWELVEANAINNSGQIAGAGRHNDQYRAFLMTPSPCTYTLDASRAVFGAGGGTDSLHITTQTGCTWKAASGLNWVAILSGATGGDSIDNLIGKRQFKRTIHQPHRCTAIWYCTAADYHKG